MAVFEKFLEPAIALDGVTYPPPDDIERYTSAGLFKPETFSAALKASFALHAKRVALSGPEGDITYAALDSRTDRIAAGLLDLGLDPLDRVLIQLPNCNELVLATVACWKAGLVPVCTLMSFREHELTYLGNLSEARAHIVAGDDKKFDFVAFAQKQRGIVSTIEHVIVARSAADGPETTLASLEQTTKVARLSEVPNDPLQAAVFQLSGGTTGVPKIIPRMHAEYLYNMRAVAEWNNWDADDVLFFPLPMMHNANMGCAWGPALLTGARLIIVPELTPESFVRVLEEHRPTWIGLAKPLLLRLADAAKSLNLDFSLIKGIVSTDCAQLANDLLGVSGFHIFGMTEGLIMFTRAGDPQAALFGTVGRPVSDFDEIRIVNPDTLEPVHDGEVGELLIKGPYTFHGYYKSDDHNAVIFTQDGFFRTGDLMRAHLIDDQYFYSFEGRIKDVVDRGNEKINCEEVERIIREHPYVADVAAVGMPDPVFGERLCAYIIPKGQFSPNLEDLGQFLSAKGVAKFKWPERVETISAFPVTGVGKLSKAALREDIAQKTAQERSV